MPVLKRYFKSKLQICVIVYTVLNLVLLIAGFLYFIYKFIESFIRTEEKEVLHDEVASLVCGANLLERFFRTETVSLRKKYFEWIFVNCIFIGIWCVPVLAEVKKNPRTFIPWIFFYAIELVLNYFSCVLLATSACNSSIVLYSVSHLVETHLVIYVFYRRMKQIEEELMEEDGLGASSSNRNSA